MRDSPDAANLLATARRTLLEELVPELPPDRRYTALMIAAAMGIAGREIAAGDRWLETERTALAHLLGDQPPDATPTELGREFAARLRRGDFDADGQAREEARGVLRAMTLNRLAECNPDYPADR